jgi:hypothetical protein
MRNRNLVSAFFILAYGVAMALMGYLGRHNFMHTEVMILVTLLAAGLAIGLFWGIWNLNLSRRAVEAGSAEEKRKRESMDSVLRGMSRDDMRMLKRRLMDEALDDGELLDETDEALSEVQKR